MSVGCIVLLLTKEKMIILQDVSYQHPNKEQLFDGIRLTVNRHEKLALIGNNGAGKSTLLQLIAGRLQSTDGNLSTEAIPYYVPQLFGTLNHLTVAEALSIDKKLKALHGILNGDASEENFRWLDDDWTIEERSVEALRHWQLENLRLDQPLYTLSGGQKTRVFLAGIAIHQPELILLDEPTNHLDAKGRALVYGLIRTTKATLIVVSHDRKLLNLLPEVAELSRFGITRYGGNFAFYTTQKQQETEALQQNIQSAERNLRKAREKERESMERQQKLDARGKGKQEKSGVARIMMNTMRNNAENSSAKLKNAHDEKVGKIASELKELRSGLDTTDGIKLHWENASLHKGKLLFRATGMNHSYNEQLLWKTNLELEIRSGERIAITGENGSGKTTLMQCIIGTLEPSVGEIHRESLKTVVIDQEYSLISENWNIYEQIQQFNTSALPEHELKIRLHRFLFPAETWDKSCSALSGGERMRLLLCCLTVSAQAPDIIVLDEPTNNLDLRNIELLGKAIQSYEGTLLVVSHDEAFLEELEVERRIEVHLNS